MAYYIKEDRCILLVSGVTVLIRLSVGQRIVYVEIRVYMTYRISLGIGGTLCLKNGKVACLLRGSQTVAEEGNSVEAEITGVYCVRQENGKITFYSVQEVIIYSA